MMLTFSTFSVLSYRVHSAVMFAKMSQFSYERDKNIWNANKTLLDFETLQERKALLASKTL